MLKLFLIKTHWTVKSTSLFHRCSFAAVVAGLLQESPLLAVEDILFCVYDNSK